MGLTRISLAAFALGASVPAIGWAQSPPAAAVVVPVPTKADRLLLRDAIDIHSHLDPDSFGAHSAQAARRLDTVDMARRAKAVGMRGFVHKEHYDPTATLAYLAMKEVPGVEVFGQLCLNRTVGGLNVAAIDHFAEIKGGRARIVSMPTWDSENNIKKTAHPDAPYVSVSKDGKLLPETVAAIAAIAGETTRDTNAKLTLATGHISAAEVLMVVREARRVGIEHIVVTHANGHPVNMTVPQMQEAARLGAMIEFAGGFMIGERAPYDDKQTAAQIRAVGVDHVVLSSDGGQVNRPYPDDMIAIMAGRLLKQGFTRAELRTMMAVNPARLLGLSPPPAR